MRGRSGRGEKWGRGGGREDVEGAGGEHECSEGEENVEGGRGGAAVVGLRGRAEPKGLDRGEVGGVGFFLKHKELLSSLSDDALGTRTVFVRGGGDKAVAVKDGAGGLARKGSDVVLVVAIE